MNKLVVAALAACLATTVSAKQPQMTVTANTSVDVWVQNASRTLDQALKRTDLARSETGVTYVQFNTDADGKPRNITTVDTGKFQPNLDRVGRQAVKRMRSLQPTFEGARPNQLIEAAIVVADNQDELDNFRTAINDRAKAQNSRWAARGEANPVVSLAAIAGF